MLDATLDDLRTLATALDPAILMEELGLEPDPWQRAILREQHPRVLMLCARQLGKSTATAILALHTALYQPGALVLLLSPSQRQSGELFRKVCGSYGDLGAPVPAEQETATTLALDNGSRIVSLPGSPATIRGFSAPALVVVDEAAMAPDELFVAVSPMLAASPGGRLVLLTTPMGKRGYFHEQWSEGGDAWHRVKVVAA